MASVTTMNTIPNVLTDLGFVPISQGISLYQNDKMLSDEDSNTDPTLIIVCPWAFAQVRPISKYVQIYQRIFPSASILLVQNAIANAIWRPDRWQMGFFQPAAAAIQAHANRMVAPRVLLHTFSNGGSHGAVQLSEVFRETCGGMKMPVDAIIFDSCPGQPRFAPTIAALTQGVPSKNAIIQGFAKSFVYGSVIGTALFDVLNIAEPAAWKLYRKLNDPADVFLLRISDGTDLKPVPRTYIFSETDTMIMAKDIVGHARIAREKLSTFGHSMDVSSDFIQLEEFVGSAHVNHIKLEGERYWNVVQRTWNLARPCPD